MMLRYFVYLAQLVRAKVSKTLGSGFKSHNIQQNIRTQLSPFIFVFYDVMVTYLFCNEELRFESYRKL